MRSFLVLGAILSFFVLTVGCGNNADDGKPSGVFLTDSTFQVNGRMVIPINDRSHPTAVTLVNGDLVELHVSLNTPNASGRLCTAKRPCTVRWAMILGKEQRIGYEDQNFVAGNEPQRLELGPFTVAGEASGTSGRFAFSVTQNGRLVIGRDVPFVFE